MADPEIVAFILVGVVGSVAVVMGLSGGWELSHELSRATDRWTSPLVIRRYGEGEAGRRQAAHEAEILERHGYRPSGQGVAPGDGPTTVTYVFMGRS